MERAANPVEMMMKDDTVPNLPTSESNERGQWANKKEYILSVFGEIIGLGNVWRFPYLCFKYGGGVFLIPYFLFLVTCGIPIFFLEVSLGQQNAQAAIICWRKMCPLLEGIGYACQVLLFYSVIYYIVILAWGVFYLFASFNSELPWTSCNNTWNTGDCVDLLVNHSSSDPISPNATSPYREFWRRRVLGLSEGIEEMGAIRWDLAGCLLLSWIVCYFCVWKGVKSSGKVVYFTASFPYVILIVLVIRGLTLPGAIDGIRFYLSPDLTHLATPQMWMDAASQVFFSNALCSSCLISLGSYNKYNNNCYKDTFALCILNSATSFVAGFAVFSVLGFISKELGVEVSAVAESGPDLAFIVYPQAVAMMPIPQLWAVAFFLMIIFLGVDSQFVYLECLVSSISDMYPSFFLIGHRRKLLLLVICVVSLLIGLCMVTQGGLYVFQLFDYYSCSGIPFLIIGILETFCIGWVYGADRYYNNIRDMIGYRPSLYMKYCWKFITPCLTATVLLFSLIKFTPLTYHTYHFPWWTHVLGLALASSSILVVLLWCIYSLAVTPGTLRQRVKMVTTPADDMFRAPGETCTVNTPRHTDLDEASKGLGEGLLYRMA